MPEFPTPPFHLFGTDHLMAIGLTIVVLVVLVVIARKFGERCTAVRWAKEILAWVLLFSYPVKVLIYWAAKAPLLDDALPMHLCNWTAVLGFLALRYDNRLHCELLYFWGLAGTLQAVLTPNLLYGFPHPVFVIFFVIHSGVVITALFVVAGLKRHPRRRGVWRAFLWAQLYLLSAGVTNWIIGSNYGFLHRKPEQTSLLDFLGQWPVYLVSLEVLALACFAVLNLPFRKEQKLESLLDG